MDPATKSLIDKLGIRQSSKVSVINIVDRTYWQQLKGRTSDVHKQPVEESDFIFIQVNNKKEVEKLSKLKLFLKQTGALWIVHPRRSKVVTERDVLQAGLAAGLVDVKVVRFSDTHTAHKFVYRLKDRQPKSFGARGEIRTRMILSDHWVLSPACIPFHHPGFPNILAYEKTFFHSSFIDLPAMTDT